MEDAVLLCRGCLGPARGFTAAGLKKQVDAGTANRLARKRVCDAAFDSAGNTAWSRILRRKDERRGSEKAEVKRDPDHDYISMLAFIARSRCLPEEVDRCV